MSSFDLLAAMGSAASLISLADTMAKAPPDAYYIERRDGSDGSVAGPIMAGLVSIAKAIPVIRGAARKEVKSTDVALFEKLPNSAIEALAKKAVEAEEKAASAFSAMEGIDRVRVIEITDTLRADMCTILRAIRDLNGGNIPASVLSKWKQFNCVA